MHEQEPTGGDDAGIPQGPGRQESLGFQGINNQGLPDQQAPHSGGINKPELHPPERNKHILQAAPTTRRALSTDTRPRGCSVLWGMVQKGLAERHLSVTRLSKETGIATKTLRNYRDGKIHFITEHVLERLCDYFTWGNTDQVRREITEAKRMESGESLLRYGVRERDKVSPDETGSARP